MLCGGTAVAGFGSLAFSSNLGMSSLGKVCAVGIGANMLISVFLLPAWWRLLSPKSKVQSPKPEVAETDASGKSARANPPAFYRGGLWRLGLLSVKLFPATLLKQIVSGLADLY